MRRCTITHLVLIIISLEAATTMTRAERVNKTISGGLFWSTAKDEADLLRTSESQHDDSSTASSNRNEFAGGFSTLDGMLQWAIGNSDPEKLKETAQDVQRLSPTELRKRQTEIQELIEKLNMPSDAQLMRIAIDDLKKSSLSLEDRYRALHELLILVEPIDNANDLNKLGGLAVIIEDLKHPDSDVRRLSAWVLGKASQNNPLVQKQVLDFGALTKLMNMVKSSSVEEAVKALYAVSALIRNNAAGQELFFAEAGDLILQDILSNSIIDIRLRRKAVFLVGDLVESLLENSDRAELPFFSNRLFLKSVVDLVTSNDLDLQEKALAATKNLLKLRTTEAMAFKEFCDLEGALEKMRQQLQELMAEDNHREYAMDLEILLNEVEMTYQRKKGQVFSTRYIVSTLTTLTKTSASIPLLLLILVYKRLTILILEFG